MAEYTRKEFAALCRTTLGIINTNVGRKKIVVFEKKIDSEDPINKKFFDTYFKKAEEKSKNKETTQQLYDKVVEKVETKSKQKEKEKRRKKSAEKSAVVVDWDLRKKKAEALLKERNAEKALLSVKKMYGEMVPLDFTKIMFQTFTKSVLSVFDNSLMNLAGVYCDELAGGDREALSRVNQKLNEELQLIINNAAEVANKDLENQIKEYSVKRGQGEKE